jgi:hypothetical protein
LEEISMENAPGYVSPKGQRGKGFVVVLAVVRAEKLGDEPKKHKKVQT